MTKVRFIGPIAGFSGEMDEHGVRRYKEKNWTTAYMKTHYPPSEAPIAHQEHWRESRRVPSRPWKIPPGVRFMKGSPSSANHSLSGCVRRFPGRAILQTPRSFGIQGQGGRQDLGGGERRYRACQRGIHPHGHGRHAHRTGPGR